MIPLIRNVQNTQIYRQKTKKEYEGWQVLATGRGTAQGWGFSGDMWWKRYKINCGEDSATQ